MRSGRRVPGAPVEQIQFRIVSSRHPGRRPSRLPGISQPGFRAGLSGRRNGPESPQPLSGIGIVGIQETADAIFPASGSNDDLVLDDEGGPGGAVAHSVVGPLNVPKNIPGLGVQRHQVGVQGGHEQLVPQQGESSIDGPAAEALVRQAALVSPKSPARSSVQGIAVVVGSRNVHDPVHHQGDGLELGGSPHTGLEHPVDPQVGHVALVNLLERPVVPAAVIPPVGEPVLRLLQGPHQPVAGHLARPGQAGKAGKHQRQAHCRHKP